MGPGFSLCFGLGLGPGLNLNHNFSHTRWEPPSGRYSGFSSSLGYYVTHSGALFGALFDSFGSPTDPKRQPTTFAPPTPCVGQMSRSISCTIFSFFWTPFWCLGSSNVIFLCKINKKMFQMDRDCCHPRRVGVANVARGCLGSIADPNESRRAPKGHPNKGGALGAGWCQSYLTER